MSKLNLGSRFLFCVLALSGLFWHAAYAGTITGTGTITVGGSAGSANNTPSTASNSSPQELQILESVNVAAQNGQQIIRAVRVHNPDTVTHFIKKGSFVLVSIGKGKFRGSIESADLQATADFSLGAEQTVPLNIIIQPDLYYDSGTYNFTYTVETDVQATGPSPQPTTDAHAQAGAYYVTGEMYQSGQLIAPFGPNESGAYYSGPKVITLGPTDLTFQQKLRDLVAANDRSTLYTLIGVNTCSQGPDYVDQNRNTLFVCDPRGNNPSATGGPMPFTLPTPQTGAMEAQQSAQLVAQAVAQTPTPAPVPTPSPIPTPTPLPAPPPTPIPTSTPPPPIPQPVPALVPPVLSPAPVASPIPKPAPTPSPDPTPAPSVLPSNTGLQNQVAAGGVSVSQRGYGSRIVDVAISTPCMAAGYVWGTGKGLAVAGYNLVVSTVDNAPIFIDDPWGTTKNFLSGVGKGLTGIAKGAYSLVTNPQSAVGPVLEKWATLDESKSVCAQGFALTESVGENISANIVMGATGGAAVGKVGTVLKYSDSAAKVANKADDLTQAVTKGWKVGDDIYTTVNGTAPTWSTVRSRFWKNAAKEFGAAEKYGQENIGRMKQGLAPQRYNPDKGGYESMELSHEPIPARDGGKDIVPRWPQDHAEVDEFRFPGY